MNKHKHLQYLKAAQQLAPIFSTCAKRQYFCFILDADGRVAGTGYNGGPPGYPHCIDGACPRHQENSPSGSEYSNCFTGDTEFITRQGTRTLEEMVGKTVPVLTSRGWKDGTVEYFGVQKVYELALKRFAYEKTIRATAEHRWFVYDSHRKRHEYLTSELRHQHYLQSTYARTGRFEICREGIKAGLVFGDGSCLYHQPGSGSHITLFGPAQQLADLFETTTNLPRRWKTEYPPLDESFGYLFGWLAGYFAADGHLSNSTPKLSSAKKEDLVHAKEVATILGLPTLGIRECQRSEGRFKDTPLFELVFPQGGLPEKFFLLDHHHEKSQALIRKRDLPRWHIKSVSGPVSKEHVYCVVQPETQEFTLADNILTGNCIATHAEMNGIAYSDATRRRNGTIVVNGPPCWDCGKVIANSGLAALVHLRDDSYADWPRVKALIAAGGIRILSYTQEQIDALV